MWLCYAYANQIKCSLLAIGILKSTVTVKERKTGISHSIKVSFQGAEEAETRVEAALAVKDSHNLSDEAWHTVVTLQNSLGSLPTLSALKRKRMSLNQSVPSIQKLDGQNGVQIDFVSSIQSKIRNDDQLREILLSNEDCPLKLRLSADGTGFKGLKSSGQVYCSFTVLNKGFDGLGLDEVLPIALFHGSESYQSFIEAFRFAVNAAQKILEEGGLELEGVGFRKVEFYVSGDYKALLLLLGVDSVSCTHPCMYCYVPNPRQGAHCTVCVKNFRRGHWIP